MPIDSVATFLRMIHACGVLEPAQLKELSTLQSKHKEPRGMAKELIQRGWLTPYQVNLLFQDREKELLLGSYVLLERLGEGGMGTVFKARHRRLKRIDALKVIRKEHLAKADSIQRFHQEAEAAARLAHPNIVSIYDAAESNGTHFLAMEFVDGLDLAKLVKQNGPLPIAQACEFIRQAALGLQHAHECGMVHRDIKPSNLFVTLHLSGGRKSPDGVVKILDMGLARIKAEDDTAGGLTQSGAVMGTPDYISPEQAMNSHKVDIRADIYSLGGSLYFLLTGKPPFPGGDLMQKLLKHQLEEPPKVEELRPEVPPAVAAVVRKMMAKKPEARYQTPLEAAQALAPFARAESPAPSRERHKPLPPHKPHELPAAAHLSEATLAFDQSAQAPPAVPLSDESLAALGVKREKNLIHRLRPLVSKHVLPLLKSKRGRIALGAGGGLLLLLFVILLWPSGKKDLAPTKLADQGIIVLEAENSKAAAMIDQSGVKIHDTAGDQSYRLKSGRNEIKTGSYEVKTAELAPGLVLSANQFSLKHGDTLKIKARFDAFEQWCASVASMSVNKQVEAVMAKLKECNPELGAKPEYYAAHVVSKIEKGQVTEFQFNDIHAGHQITDISPLRALKGFKRLIYTGASQGFQVGGLTDLSQLKGMPLTSIHCWRTQIADLSPLQGMPLTKLTCSQCPISDLSPLKGMQLTELDCSETRVIDLSPLQGMPLGTLNCSHTKVVTLAPLKDLPLREITCDSPEKHVEFIRAHKTLERINGQPVAEFLKEADAKGAGKKP